MNTVDLYTEDRLIEILKPYDWHLFENTVDGHLKFNALDFYLRVGFFMKRAMRVVMACGKYVWMKEEKVYTTQEYCLKALDPAKPDNNLYATNYPDCPSGWRPVHLYTGLQGFVGVTTSMPYGSSLGQNVTALWNTSPATWTTNNTLQSAQIQAQGLLQQAQQNYTTAGLGHVPSLPRVK